MISSFNRFFCPACPAWPSPNWTHWICVCSAVHVGFNLICVQCMYVYNIGLWHYIGIHARVPCCQIQGTRRSRVTWIWPHGTSAITLLLYALRVSPHHTSTRPHTLCPTLQNPIPPLQKIVNQKNLFKLDNFKKKKFRPCNNMFAHAISVLYCTRAI